MGVHECTWKIVLCTNVTACFVLCIRSSIKFTINLLLSRLLSLS